MSGSHPPLVDLHAHFVTEAYVEQAVAAGHARPDGMPEWPRWDVERHLRTMDTLGIGTSVLSLSSPGVLLAPDAPAIDLAREINDSAAAFVRSAPDRLRFLASLPLPDVDAAVAEWERVSPLDGCVGAVLMSHLPGTTLADPGLDPLWRALDRTGAVVLVHPTAPLGVPTAPGRPAPVVEFAFQSTRAQLDLLATRAVPDHPRIRWVFPHCGGALPYLVERVELFQRGDLVDGALPPLRDRLRSVWFDCAGTPLPTQLPTLLRYADPARIVYGSDFCWTPAEGVALQLGTLDAGRPAHDPRSWREILAANGAALLGEPAPAPWPRADPRRAVVERVFRTVARRLVG